MLGILLIITIFIPIYTSIFTMNPIWNPHFDKENIVSSSNNMEVNVSENTLSTETKILINKNNEINQKMSDEIIAGIDSGEIFKYNWEYSLDATYFGLVILESLDRLNSINIEHIRNYILSLFHPSEGIFYDSAYRYLNYSINEKIGYSKVEATAYAILCMDIIGRINDFSQLQKVFLKNFLLSAINPEDGGFYHRTDGLRANFRENSSIHLSYLCYNALRTLDSNPLNPVQVQNLVNFISNKQRTDMVGIPQYNGAFNDGDLMNKDTLTAAYFATSLLSSLNMIGSMNSVYLVEHIESMNDGIYGGIYFSYTEDFFGYNASYSSTAIGMTLGKKLGWINGIDESLSANYIRNGILASGYWPSRSGGKINYLSDIALIVKGFIESGNSFSVIELNLINLGIQSFLRSFNSNRQGFSLLSNNFGNIIDISEKLSYLEEYGELETLTSIQVEKIINFTDSCLDQEISPIKIYKFPELYKNLEDFPIIPANKPYFISDIPIAECGGDTYERGMQCIYAFLSIRDTLQEFNHIESIFNVTEIATEILECQFNPDIYTGGFYPYSEIKSNLETFPERRYLYESPMISYYAIQSLKIIDENNESSFLLDINSTSLSEYFKSMNVSNTESYYIESSINPSSLENIKLSLATYKIDEIISLNLFDSNKKQKINYWLMNHDDFPAKINLNFDVRFATFAVKLIFLLDPSNTINLNLEPFREIYTNWFEISTTNNYIAEISNEQLEILRLMLSTLR